MSKTIIALWGKSKVGKTFTINSTFSKVLAKYPDSFPTIYNEHNTEILAVIRINGIIVGFTSIGDVGEQVEKNLKFLVKKKCSVILCATRTRGKTVEAVENYQKKFTIQWVEQKIELASKIQLRSNLNMANKIVALISKLI